jgi:hypothetical protein
MPLRKQSGETKPMLKQKAREESCFASLSGIFLQEKQSQKKNRLPLARGAVTTLAA